MRGGFRFLFSRKSVFLGHPNVYDCNCFDKSQPEKKLEKIMRHFPPSLNPHLQICDILKRVLDLKR